MRSRWRVLSRGVRPAAFLQPSRWPLRGQVQEATLEPPVQVQREAVVAGHTQEGRTEGSPPLGPPSLLCSPSLAIHIRDSGTRVQERDMGTDRKSTRLNSSHANISYAVFCLKKKSIIPPV